MTGRTMAGGRVLPAAVLRRFRDIVGAQHVITEPEVMASYAVDWTGRFVGSPAAVLRPGDRAEVTAVVARCREDGVALVPQGGNTGLVGGGVPLGGEVVLSLRRLSGVTDVDPLGGQLSVGAGTTVGEVQAAAAAAGWAYGVDLGSRDSATIGGTVATNAGGLQVLRYGPTRAQMVGFAAVLGTAAFVSHMGGLVKDNTGYDLGGLLCGSEGTLGVLTAIRLRLVPPTPSASWPFSASPPSKLPSRLRRSCGAPSPRCTRSSCSSIPASSWSVVPAACRGRSTGPARRTCWSRPRGRTTRCRPWPAPSTPSRRSSTRRWPPTRPRRSQLWRYREGHSEAINALGAPHKLDVTLPAASLAAFVERVPGVVAGVDPGAATWLFGHVGDGNVHVNITGVAPDDLAVDDRVLTLAAGLGGSISSEHGIGTAKRPWLHLNRSDAEVAAFRRLKSAFDPAGILNPNVLLPPV